MVAITETDNASAENTWLWIVQPKQEELCLSPFYRSSENTEEGWWDYESRGWGRMLSNDVLSTPQLWYSWTHAAVAAFRRPARDQDREHASSDGRGLMRAISNWELLSVNGCWGRESVFSDRMPRLHWMAYTRGEEAAPTGLSGLLRKKKGKGHEIGKGMCQMSW